MEIGNFPYGNMNIGVLGESSPNKMRFALQNAYLAEDSRGKNQGNEVKFVEIKIKKYVGLENRNRFKIRLNAR